MKKLLLLFAVLLFSFYIHPPESSALEDKLMPITGKTMSGETIDLDRVLRENPVLLFFWASW